MSKWVFVFACILLLASAGYCTDYDGILQDAKNRAVAGDFTPAISLCSGVINAHLGAPVEPKALLLLGHILSKQRMPASELISEFAQVVDRFPSSPEAPEALLRIGYLHERLKQPTTEWERIVEKYPATAEAAEALHCLGHQALKHSDPALAIQKFKESAAVREADSGRASDSLVEAGYACISQYWKTRDRSVLRDAQEVFESLIASSAKTLPAVRAHLGLGEICLIQRSGGDAARHYEAALAGKPDHPYLLGIAEFGLGSALYAKQDYASAVTAFTKFLDDRKGRTLTEKDLAWKQTRPGYSESAISEPTRTGGLSRADLVPVAAYWKAASLVEMKHYREAQVILDELRPFKGSKIVSRVSNLSKICAHMLREDK